LRYRRANAEGATYFFTVNLADRKSDTLLRHIDDLRTVIDKVKLAHPFSIVAMVVLPEHLHAIWRLPPGDADYPMRWSLIKAGFSRRLPSDECVPASRTAKRERGIWQRRYWEHQIPDEADLERHVKHSLQPGQARLGQPSCRLATFNAARLHRTRDRYSRLGRLRG
jgi:putative transposase